MNDDRALATLYSSDSLLCNDDIILSIRAKHSRRIYAGAKLYELRKILPKTLPRRIFLYEAGRQVITGHIIVNHALRGDIQSLWLRVGELATTKERFFDYFSNRDTGCALHIAHSCAYERPISLAELQMLSPSLKPPQSFLYSGAIETVEHALSTAAITNSFLSTQNGIILRAADSSDSALFRSLVEQYIPKSYLDTKSEYGRYIFDSYLAGKDHEGVFTRRKYIFRVNVNDEVAGYTVLTEKIAGTIKTGPTILKPSQQNKGIGVKLRTLLYAGLKRAGYRKVYCTAPSDNQHVLAYLLESGMHVEAHLRKHYHTEHDDLVFGVHLDTQKPQAPRIEMPYNPVDTFYKVRAKNPKISRFIQENLEHFYLRPPPFWAQTQVKKAAAIARGMKVAVKGRLVYVGEGSDIYLVALCVFKRGGSAKLLILSETTCVTSIVHFLRFIEASLKRSKNHSIKKLYCHVPLGAAFLIESFNKAEFCLEGILERPYSARSDMLVYYKPLVHP